jgi:hypothetical protein
MGSNYKSKKVCQFWNDRIQIISEPNSAKKETHWVQTETFFKILSVKKLFIFFIIQIIRE